MKTFRSNPVAVAIASTLIAASGGAQANDPAYGPLDAGTVVVSATRSGSDTLTVSAPITVITREQIEASAATRITDVIRGHGGVQITDLTGDGGNTTVSVRGFAQTANANVLILIDGRRLNYADTRAPDLGHIALQDVERIEVLQGSAGTLFGAQAVGGVVNIITRKPQEKRVRVEGEIGSYKLRTGRVYLADAMDNGFSYRLSGEARETENYRDNNSQQFENTSALVSYSYDDGEVFAELQHTEDFREQPGALLINEVEANRQQSNAGFVDDFSDIRNDVRRLGLKHALNDNWGFEGEVTSRELDQRLTQSFRGFPSPAGGHAGRDQLSINPRMVGALPVGDVDMRVTAGLDWDQSKINVFIPNAFGAVIRSVDQEMKAVYAQASYPISEQLDLTFGARHAEVDSRMSDATAFPAGRDSDDSVLVKEIGVAYRISPEWRVFARRDENFRFAKVDELTNAGGVALKTQEGVSYELGAEWRNGERYLSGNLYRLALENEIAFDPTVGLFGQNVNLDETRRHGLILAGGMPSLCLDDIYVSANLSLVDARFTSGTFDGNKISGVADAMLTLRAEWRPNEVWSVLGELQGVNDKPAQGDNANNQPEASGYGVVNLGVGYQRGAWSARLRVNNLANKEYTELVTNSGFGAGFQPSPERNASLTVGYDF